jgi:HEAT repeat protein
MLAQKTTKPPIQVQAWDLLHAGVKDENTEKRTTAVRVLSLLPGDKEAVKLAEKALQDKKPEVRAAAAMALGEVHSTSSMPKLRQALSDKEVPVVVAAAHSLLLLKDKSAYDIYYAILTGQRRSSHGLIEEQMATLKDRRQMAEFGFEQAIGYVPFAGMGYDAIRALRKEDASPVRAAAARVLADDTDPSTGQALLETAVGDKEWVIRAAALDAIARRGDPALLEKLWPTLTDDKDPVRYTAAAAVLRLTAIAKNKVKNK